MRMAYSLRDTAACRNSVKGDIRRSIVGPHRTAESTLEMALERCRYGRSI